MVKTLSPEAQKALVMQDQVEAAMNVGFDGSFKAQAGKGRDIKYHEATSPYLEELKKKVMAAASPEAIAYLDPLNYKGPKVICDAATLKHDQWQAMRADSIGSSAISQVFGESPYPGCTNIDLYFEKTGMAPVIPDDATEAQKRKLMFLWGHLMESFLQELVQDLYPGAKLFIDTNIYANPKYPFLTGNLDAMMLMPDGRWIHVEFKTTNEFGDAAYDGDSIPPHYRRQLIQCQNIMGVWESKLFVLLSRDKVLERDYIRDLDAEMETIEGGVDFWVGNVMANIQPPLLGPAEHIINALRRYSGYGNPKAPEITLPNNLTAEAEKLYAITQQLDAANQEVKRLKGLKEGAMVELCDAMLTNTRAYVSDGTRAFQIKWEPRAGNRAIDWDRFKREEPAMYDRWVTKKAEASRPMSITEVNVR